MGDSEDYIQDETENFENEVQLDSFPESNLSTDELIHNAYENDPVSKELFRILGEGSKRRMPAHLLKNGHHFSLADCQIRGHQDTDLDRRRLYVNDLLQRNFEA
ncbi:hypothetical protein GcM3_206023 [Golovinomyces cichoracearum]|uniref:Uncharacterized protein n=1 Tax=Golovinomyces cichoracearum TaxID=62708 RepID=A0A420HBV4_9PEZI|nr:hypothetical protein GcM3_206023 [Golovinomyces cichoracearum]